MYSVQIIFFYIVRKHTLRLFREIVYWKLNICIRMYLNKSYVCLFQLNIDCIKIFNKKKTPFLSINCYIHWHT